MGRKHETLTAYGSHSTRDCFLLFSVSSSTLNKDTCLHRWTVFLLFTDMLCIKTTYIHTVTTRINVFSQNSWHTTLVTKRDVIMQCTIKMGGIPGVRDGLVGGADTPGYSGHRAPTGKVPRGGGKGSGEVERLHPLNRVLLTFSCCRLCRFVITVVY